MYPSGGIIVLAALAAHYCGLRCQDHAPHPALCAPQFPGIPLLLIDSPYRTVADPIASWVNDRLHRALRVTVMVPVLEVRKWYRRPLVNQSLKRLTKLLEARRQVNVVYFPLTPAAWGEGAGAPPSSVTASPAHHSLVAKQSRA